MGAKTRRALAALFAAALLAGLVAVPAAAQDPDRLGVVADGLHNPRGITIAADGTIYVAEAGLGGDEFCLEDDDGDDEVCLGTTSRVLSIDGDGEVTVVVDDLPSIVTPEGEVVGAADVVVAEDGTIYVAIGFGEASPVRDAIADEWEPAALFGTVIRVVGDTITGVADLAAWETANDPDADQPSTQGPMGQESDHSNPNGLVLTSDGRLLAVDAGGNTILEVDFDADELTMVGLIGDRFAPAPPFLQLPEGTEIPMQAVPTNAIELDDGTILVTELTGFPFPVGAANVYALTDTETPEVILEGFTNAMDLAAVGDDLYVVEFARDGLLAGPTGALVRVRGDGTRVSLLGGDLLAPGGIAADGDGMLYLTVGAVGPPGSGAVVRFDPSLAADAAIQSACPPLVVPGSALSDIARTTHEEAVTCVAWHGLFAGFGDGTFRPGQDITRGQFATTIAGLIRASDADLPAGPTGAFGDVDGTTHAPAINDLAAAGLVRGFDEDTFLPSATITRAQAVSMIVAAYVYVSGSDLPVGSDSFTDTAGSVHAANIRDAAGMGWVQGTTAGIFSPAADISRGQTASVLARVASDLVDGGHLALPS